jgi:uncharacterized protein (TIGR02001 family)
MNRLLRSFSVTAMLSLPLLLSSQAHAVEGLSANVAATSNYLWRGISQTDDAAAISGGIDYTADSGFHLGAWASNVDFGDDASHELDLYFGYGAAINPDLSYDLGYILYVYPGSDESDSNNDYDYDFGEIYASFTYQNLTFAANYTTNTDDGAESLQDSLYLAADAEFEISEGLTVNLHIANYSFDDAFDDADYTNYGISLAKNGLTLGISDTDKDNDDVTFYVSYAMDIDL